MKLSHLAGLASLACIGAAIACGSSSNKGGGGEPDGGGGGGEGGRLDGGGGETGPSKLPYVGSVSADTTVAATTTTHSLTGVFVAASDAGAAGADGGTCLGTESGSCCYVPPGALAEAGAGGDAGTATLVGAGTLTVKDGTTLIANITPASNNGYGIASTNNPSVTWKGGDSLGVSAEGGIVEAFSGTMTAVEDFAGLTPALSYKTATTVPIASDLVIKWTAGNGTTVHVLVDALKGTANAGTISCSAADSTGTVTVPAALLGKLAAGDTGLITLDRSSVTQVTGQNATVALISTSTTGGTAKFQ